MKFCRAIFLLIIGATELLFVPRMPAQATIQQIRSNGPTSKYINIVYMSEGYTTNQLPQFLTNATNLMNKLLTIPPWSSYSNYFNVFAISVASAQSGSDHYTPTINLVDTYFNSNFDSYGAQRLLTIPPNDRDGTYANGQGKVDALLQQLMPEYDIVGIIVNDPVYGGSGGSTLLTSLEFSSSEIFNHEIGHSFAALGDEYTSAYPGYPSIEEPNTITNAFLTNVTQVKWKDWVLPTTLIPTPNDPTNNAVVGAFQGAHYNTTGWYRPKRDCKMRTLNVPYCEVCAEALVLSIYRVIRPIQSFSPASTNLTINNQDIGNFSIGILKPATNTLNVQWFTNNVVVTGATGTNFSIGGARLLSGTNQIKVRVNDPTGHVRTDPASDLWETNDWTLVVSTTVVPPIISNPKLTGTTFTLSVPTQVGFNYVLEYKNSVSDANWIAVHTNGGSGGEISLTNVGTVGPSRIYRVRVQ